MTNYFVRQKAKRYGPLTAKVVKQLVAKGKIDREDLIANHPDGPWYRAGGIKSLRNAWRMASSQNRKASNTGDHFLSPEEVGSAALPKRVAKRLTEIVAPGVLCQWSPDGVQQFPEPKRVVKFSPDGGFAFFADSATGVPVSEIETIREAPTGPTASEVNKEESDKKRRRSQDSEPEEDVFQAFNSVFDGLFDGVQPEREGGSGSVGDIVGIDLGTTHSLVAVMDGGRPRVIANASGDHLLRSVVFYGKEDEVLVGESALKHGLTSPDRTITSIKRLIGRPLEEVTAERVASHYTITGDQSGNAQVVINGTPRSAERVSSEILVRLKETAEQELGRPVSRAVVTVPAHFTNQQRSATKTACELAGLEVARLINEPTAAALAYVESCAAKGQASVKEQRIVVFDLGGGSCDVSIVEAADNATTVLSTYGDTGLGGNDFREALVDHVVNAFVTETGVDLQKQFDAMPRVRQACELAKCNLSYASETLVEIPFVAGDDDCPLHMRVSVSRDSYEKKIERLVDRCLLNIEKALQGAALNKDDIDGILLVGGSTQTPRIREMIRLKFGKEPYAGINPLEAVAIGAAVQGGILAGGTRDILLLDVTPFTLAIETEGGVATPLVAKNSSIPLERKSVFSTAEDNQTAVTVKVFEGEDELTKENRLLGEFNLEGIPRAARGVPQIEVQFDIDANGILSVGAKELGTGKEMVVRMS